MTEFKGTSGPLVADDGRHGRVFVRAANNVIVAKSMRTSLVDTGEEEANARLIAASLELLALAERLAEFPAGKPYPISLKQDARALVARIKGGGNENRKCVRHRFGVRCNASIRSRARGA